MKTWLVLLLLPLCGCASVSRSVMEYRTNAVPEVVRIPATTNTVIQGTTVNHFVTPETIITNWTTNVLVSLRPVVTNTLSTLSFLNETMNPTPSAPIVNLALGAASGLLGLWAALAQKKANARGNLLGTVIAGVEHAGNPDVKKAIETVSRLAGNNRALDTEVQARTG